MNKKKIKLNLKLYIELIDIRSEEFVVYVESNTVFFKNNSNNNGELSD